MSPKDFALGVLASILAAVICQLFSYARSAFTRFLEVTKALRYKPISRTKVPVGITRLMKPGNRTGLFVRKRLSYPFMVLILGLVLIALAPFKIDRDSPPETYFSTRSIWPVEGTLKDGFGGRRNPFTGRGYELHEGQDIDAAFGTPVLATAGGKVTIAEWQRGYGNVIYIDHGSGLSTRYGHLHQIDVSAGQDVRQGETIGRLGSTGRSIGPTLHYEVRISGAPVDPRQYHKSTSPLTNRRLDQPSSLSGLMASARDSRSLANPDCSELFLRRGTTSSYVGRSQGELVDAILKACK